jgi:hypothetical protein
MRGTKTLGGSEGIAGEDIIRVKAMYLPQYRRRRVMLRWRL